MIVDSVQRLQHNCHIIILNNFVLQPTQGYKMQNKRRQKYNQNMNPNNQSYSKNYNNITQIEQFLPEKKRRVEIIPRNLNQETYLDLLLNPDISIVIASGPAGTGKTLLAMQAAIKALKEREIEKIILTRPAVGVEGEKHGFLPGDLNQKMEPWTKPLFDVLHEYYTTRETMQMVDNQVIEICPLAFMRGRTFKKSMIIADEMQNATPNQMKMLLTRIGEESKIVVTGDVRQTDRTEGENGLLDFNRLMDRFRDSEYVGCVEFNGGDIERHPAVEEILRIYGDI
jgi:phosphate starvation-inducible PhoH-like protein